MSDPTSTPTDPTPGATPGATRDGPGPFLQRVVVVVDLEAPADADVAHLVAESLPLEDLPAMADDAARDDDVRVSSDGTALEVVLLVEAGTEAEAMDAGVAATQRALRAAGLPPEVARPGQVTAHEAYTP